MLRKSRLAGIFLAIALAAALPIMTVAAPSASPGAQSGELLANPGFEGISCRPGSVPPQCLDNYTHAIHWTDEGEHGNIFTPQGWVIWWDRSPNYGQPEVLVIPAVVPYIGAVTRIRSGYYAVKYFNYYRNQNGGLYQVVTGLQPGATVQFSIHAHTWSCDRMEGDSGPGTTCGDRYNVALRVGIEPNGVADPFSPTVIWSTEQYIPDFYGLVGPVTAQVGPSGSVTVIAHARSKWALEHNDTYWDDASLVYVGNPPAPANTPAPAAQVPAAPAAQPAAPRPTATPYPDGSIVHTVQSGETLSSIAMMYGVSVDQIRQLNSMAPGETLIVPGQLLVIVPASQVPTPTLPPAPPEPAPTPAESAAAIPTVGGSICVLAYHDRNANGLHEPTEEELLPKAQIYLADATSIIGLHTTTGLDEPHCFAGLAPGTYRLRQESPATYAPSPSSPADQSVTVGEGETVEVAFGNIRSDSAAASSNDPGEEEADASSGATTLANIAKFTGLGGLALAAVLAVLFFFSRRRHA